MAANLGVWQKWATCATAVNVTQRRVIYSFEGHHGASAEVTIEGAGDIDFEYSQGTKPMAATGRFWDRALPQKKGTERLEFKCRRLSEEEVAAMKGIDSLEAMIRKRLASRSSPVATAASGS